MSISFNGSLVVIRSGQSGVHVGTLVAKKYDRVWLENSIRLWSWCVAKKTGQVASCSEIAVYGLKMSACRVGAQLPMIEIGGVVEIIPLSPIAAETVK